MEQEERKVDNTEKKMLGEILRPMFYTEGCIRWSTYAACALFNARFRVKYIA